MLLKVFEADNIVIRPQHIIDELFQSTWPLSKTYQEIMFQALILQGPFFYFLHAINISIAAADNTYYILSNDLISVIVQRSNRQSPRWLYHERVFVIQL